MDFKILAFVILSAFAIIVSAEDPPPPPPPPPPPQDPAGAPPPQDPAGPPPPPQDPAGAPPAGAPPAPASGGVRARELVEQNAPAILMKLKEKSPELPDDTKIVAIGVKTYNDKDVPGLSYFIRVKAGELFYHVRLVENEGRASVMVVKGPLPEKDPLVYFE